jgi:peptidyl-prolyl cis-trans isomerase SurA
MPILPIVATLICLTASARPAAAVPELIDRIVGVVDNQIILWSELNYRMRFELEERGYADYADPERLDSLRTAVLNEMVDEHVLVLKAQLDSVQIDFTEVEETLAQEFRRIKGSMSEADFREMLDRVGLAERQLKARYRREIRHRLYYRQMRAEQSYRQHITRRDVDAFKEAHRDSLPERISLSHINLKIRPSGQVLEEKLARLEEVRQLLDGGADFAELAREYSEDPGTAAQGGDLGCFGRGELVPEFEEVAFQLKPGEVSEPVLTEFGYHLIKLREKREGTICASHVLMLARSSDSDKDRVQQELRDLRAEALAGEDFATLARKHSQTAATAMRGGLWDVFPREQMPPFLAAHLRGLGLGDISEPFFLDDGGHIVKINDDQANIETLIREERTASAIDGLIRDHRQDLHIETRLDPSFLRQPDDDDAPGSVP